MEILVLADLAPNDPAGRTAACWVNKREAHLSTSSGVYTSSDSGEDEFNGFGLTDVSKSTQDQTDN
jgi:hypothetical protein